MSGVAGRRICDRAQRVRDNNDFVYEFPVNDCVTSPVTATPRHLAVIPDGNRRWARARGEPPEAGHRAGINVVGDIAAAAWDQGVEVFTFWWGSPANLTRRSAPEVAAIVDALNGWLRGPGAALLRDNDARFEIHGRWQALCPQIAGGVDQAGRAAGSGPRRLVLLMAYDGREEILAAAQRAGCASLDVDAFGRLLWTGGLPPVDLLIRCGGEPHLSAGFMMWQIAESQLAWPEEMWPAFTPGRLQEILSQYRARQRRFGA